MFSPVHVRHLIQRCKSVKRIKSGNKFMIQIYKKKGVETSPPVETMETPVRTVGSRSYELR
jgi:hypothetical protein